VKNKKSILLIGPFPKPVTGLSLANEVLYKGLKKNNNVDYIDMSYSKFEEIVGSFNFYKMVYFLKLNLRAFKIHKYDSIYITIGQSFFGVIKYAFHLFIGKIFRKKIVIHLHGNQLGEMYKQQSFFKKEIIKRVLSMSDYGIVLSNSLKKNLTPFLNQENIFVVENFVENNLHLKPEEKYLKDYTSLKIVFLGNLMTEKGVFYLLEALVKLNNNGVLFKAKFAGNIDNLIYNKVMCFFEENKNFQYLGVIRGDEKKELLLWGNTFVFPSYLIEGLPLSILEAISTGNFIITTKHTALLDIFTGDNLCFINKNSIEEIVNSLTKKNTPFDKNIINNNYEIVAEFTEENFVAKIEKILN
jgi:glycosyltransferase involved in cell wall biosynthesis